SSTWCSASHQPASTNHRMLRQPEPTPGSFSTTMRPNGQKLNLARRKAAGVQGRPTMVIAMIRPARIQAAPETKPPRMNQRMLRKSRISRRFLAPGGAVADAVEPLLDDGEAGLDHRLELGVGEDVGPVAFDALAHQFADVERVDALGQPLAQAVEARRGGAFGRQGRAPLLGDPRAEIVGDVGVDEP